MKVLMATGRAQLKAFEAACASGPKIFAVDTAPSGEDALDLLKVYDYDLVVMEPDALADRKNVNLPAFVRTLKNPPPVLMIGSSPEAGQAQKQKEIEALNAGAARYMPGPVDPVLLIANMQAVVRLARGAHAPVIQLGAGVEVDISARRVYAHGRQVDLAPREYAVMEVMALRKGAVLKKETILDHISVGEIDPPEPRLIDVYIAKIRQKIAQTGNGHHCIETIWGRGFSASDKAILYQNQREASAAFKDAAPVSVTNTSVPENAPEAVM
jgi:two-component system, cell cycle response regulator CtrA